MAKSARASRIKKNKSALRKKVFGPVEAARNERLSAKLTELAKAPKPAKEEMELEEDGGASKDAQTEAANPEDPSMEIDGGATIKISKSKRELDRLKAQRVERRHRRERNQVKFSTHSKKKGNKR